MSDLTDLLLAQYREERGWLRYAMAVYVGEFFLVFPRRSMSLVPQLKYAKEFEKPWDGPLPYDGSRTVYGQAGNVVYEDRPIAHLAWYYVSYRQGGTQSSMHLSSWTPRVRPPDPLIWGMVDNDTTAPTPSLRAAQVARRRDLVVLWREHFERINEVFDAYIALRKRFEQVMVENRISEGVLVRLFGRGGKLLPSPPLQDYPLSLSGLRLLGKRDQFKAVAPVSTEEMDGEED